MTKVKICGVTNLEDALIVTNVGADFIGFNFWPQSPRKISERNCKEIVLKLPPFITPVGVFVDEDIEQLKKIAKKCSLKAVQLHGSETPDYCQKVSSETSLPVIKAFRIENEGSIEAIRPFLEAVNYLLLDAFVPGEPGGTGEVFNWDIALKAKDFNKPFFLAGGLTPENIGEAISKVAPFAVDVASGVERLPRRKDYDKVNKFVRTARGLKT